MFFGAAGAWKPSERNQPWAARKVRSLKLRPAADQEKAERKSLTAKSLKFPCGAAASPETLSASFCICTRPLTLNCFKRAGWEIAKAGMSAKSISGAMSWKLSFGSARFGTIPVSASCAAPRRKLGALDARLLA